MTSIREQFPLKCYVCDEIKMMDIRQHECNDCRLQWRSIRRIVTKHMRDNRKSVKAVSGGLPSLGKGSK
jgi:hypothetical protein